MAGAAGFALLLALPAQGANRALKEGDAVPELTLRSVSGAVHSLAKERGKVVVLCFFRADQDRSVRALNDLTKVVEDGVGLGISAFGVAAPGESGIDGVRALQGKLSLPYPILLDPDHKAHVLFGVGDLPHTVMVDPQGRMAFSSIPVGAGFSRTVLEHARVARGLLPGQEPQGGGGAAPRQAERDLALARTLLQKGFPDRALPVLEEVLVRDPSRVEAHLLAGEIHLARGGGKEARPHFEKVLGWEPASPEGHAGMGGVFLLEGDLERAEAEYRTALPLCRDPGRVMYGLGRIYERRDKVEQAMEWYRKACEEMLKDRDIR